MAKPVELSEIVGGYVLERVLGRGGMGTVFLGKHRLLGRPAAVKVLDAEMAGNEQLVSRFFHEARIVNDVRHPNIVDVIDFVRTEHPRRVAFIMEYLEGDSLDRHLKEHGALSAKAAINIVIQILDGLSAVHAIGVIHRDLKPANLRFTTKSIGDCSTVPIIKILDFGIAKASGPMVAHKTQTGLVMGTPAYMAPEQVSGESVSLASDVYAVGEIMYELLGGKRLFVGSNTEVLRAKLAVEPPPIDLPAELPARDALVELIRSCLAFEAAKRPTTQSLIASLASIRDLLAGAVPVDFVPNAKPTTLVPAPTPAPRTPAPVRTSAPQPAADTPAPMNTLAAEKSLYGAPPRSRSILPFALIAMFTVGLAGTLLLVPRSDEPIVVRAVPDPSPPTTLPPPAPPPPIATEQVEEPAPETEKVKTVSKKKKRKERVRHEKSAVPPPSPPPPKADEERFGRIKVTAWTTAGRQVPATVKIDGRAVSRAAPLEVKARAGKRTIEVEAVGHPRKVQEIVVKEGETTTVDVVVDLR